MRLLTLLLSTQLIFSCVELPDLTPNGSGGNNDMVVIQYEYLRVANDTIIVNDSLKILPTYPNGIWGCPDLHIKVINGQVLDPTNYYRDPNYFEDDHYLGLKPADLVGGSTQVGKWNWSYQMARGSQIAGLGFSCIIYSRSYSIIPNQEVIVGMRFKGKHNRWHYGWITFYHDIGENRLNHLLIKSVAYNTKTGIRARVQ